MKLIFWLGLIAAIGPLIAQGETKADFPLVDALECRARGGLPNVLARLKSGKEVRVAYIGGSITAGQGGYRTQTTEWLRRQYPQTKIDEIEAAVGGTGSDLGVFRFAYQVLEKKPHLVFIEFAVNDSFTAPKQIIRQMEGMVRQTWHADRKIDLCFVYTMKEEFMPDLSKGKLPRSPSAMEQVADHYGIPTIHLGAEAVKLAAEGKLVISANPKSEAEKEALKGKIIFSGDGVHPHPDTGQRIYFEAIARSLQTMNVIGKPGKHRLIPPLMTDNLENAKLVPVGKAKLSNGWELLDPEKSEYAKWYHNVEPNLWVAREPGETMTFRFKGTRVGFLDVCAPDTGQVEVVVDGGKPQVVKRFTPYTNGAHITAFTVAEGLPDKEHTVSVRIDAGTFDKAAILAIAGNKIDKPERYHGTSWYVGWIMVVGDVVKN